MPRKTSSPIAVVMGLSPTGLHVVRTLGQSGVQVIGISDGFQPGNVSRYLKRHISVSRSEDKLAALLEIAPERQRGDADRPVLIPTSDQDIDLVMSNSVILAQRYNFQASYSDGIAAKILDKDSFYVLCSAYGIKYPGLWTSDLRGLRAVLEAAALPCIIKPSRIHDIKDQMQGKKGWTILDRAQVDTVIATIPEACGTLIVQEIVPGPESAISLACAHIDVQGEARQVFTARKLRQYPPGFGSASLVQSGPEPEAAERMQHFLKAVGYKGIAAAEFKRHPDTGQLYIIEVNVRPSLWFSLTEAAGRPVVRSLYEELGRQPSVPEAGEQLDGVRWRYWIKDLWSGLFYRRNPDYFLGAPDTGALGAPTKRILAVFSMKDPLPGFAELLNFLVKLVGRSR